MQETRKAVLLLAGFNQPELVELLSRYGLELREVGRGSETPGSYWGDQEAGLRGSVVLARPDTPIHSVLHESCHFICMDPERRGRLDTDAGGDYQEENAVCYLQILLADQLPGMGRERMMADMDAWGYSFRLGSARDWFEQDAGDAKAWLVRYGLIDRDQRVQWTLRNTA